jgi:hypothetical protein
MAMFLAMQQSVSSRFSVMSCSSTKIDRGGRGWDRGARIFLPPSLLDTILKMQDMGRAAFGEVMLFEVKNRDAVVHVGVQVQSLAGVVVRLRGRVTFFCRSSSRLKENAPYLRGCGTSSPSQQSDSTSP